uniref:Uncharacterized protein n=1 Tax=Cyanothece sp. (strain PCC 7425 / ATCC 29141) TaxID=395961 RepID=B8HR40_CYAP4
MEILTSFFRLGVFALTCFFLLLGLSLLIFAAPWEITLPVLTLTLIVGLFYLQGSPALDTDTISSAHSSQAPAEFPRKEALSYRGVKYVRSDESSSDAASKSLSPQDLIEGDEGEEIIGQYRGGLLKFPALKRRV